MSSEGRCTPADAEPAAFLDIDTEVVAVDDYLGEEQSNLGFPWDRGSFGHPSHHASFQSFERCLLRWLALLDLYVSTLSDCHEYMIFATMLADITLHVRVLTFNVAGYSCRICRKGASGEI